MTPFSGPDPGGQKFQKKHFRKRKAHKQDKQICGIVPGLGGWQHLSMCSIFGSVLILDGRNHAIVIAESLAGVIAAIRIASIRWPSYLSPKAQKLVLVDPAFVALPFESCDWRSFVQH